jgi:RecA/RadA recombinase
MAVLTDEGMLQAARLNRDSAERMEHAASVIEEAARRIGLMFEDGYGGNALKLIELLEAEITTRADTRPDRGMEGK